MSRLDPSPRGATRRDLKTLGILKPDSSDRLADCLTFPIMNPEGMIVGITGWDPATNREVRLPRLSRGLWNASAVILHSDLIIAPNIIDGLILLSCGYRNTVVVCDPARAESANLAVLTEHSPHSVCCLVRKREDSDRLEPILKEAAGDKCHLCFRLLPKGHSLAAYLLKYGREALIEWLESKPEPVEEQAESPKKDDSLNIPAVPMSAFCWALCATKFWGWNGMQRT